MAGRPLGKKHDQRTRDKIQTTQLVNALTNHVLGKNEMGSTQVTAALGLLKKSLPDMSAIHSTEGGEKTFEEWVDELKDSTEAED